MPLPEALTTRPKLLPDLIPIWNCWTMLDAARDLDGVVAGLRLSVSDCLDLFGVPRNDRPRWVRLLLALERTYRDHLNRTIDASKERKSDG